MLLITLRVHPRGIDRAPALRTGTLCGTVRTQILYLAPLSVDLDIPGPVLQGQQRHRGLLLGNTERHGRTGRRHGYTIPTSPATLNFIPSKFL